MQDLTFVSANKGTAKGTGKPYNMVSLSDGIEAFTADNVHNLDLSNFKRGDKVKVRLTASAFMKGVRVALEEMVKAK